MKKRAPLGRVLVQAGIIDEAQLDDALALQRAWDVPLGQAVLCLGTTTPRAFYAALARHFSLPFIDLMQQPPEDRLLAERALDFYLAAEAVPCRDATGRLRLATPDPLHAAETLARFHADWRGTPAGDALPPLDTPFAITSRLDVLWTLQAAFETALSTRARYALDARDPVNSARAGLTLAQQAGFAIAFCLVAGGLVLFPFVTGVILNLLFAAFFAGVIGLRAASIPLGLAARRRMQRDRHLPDERDLPVYSILVPLFQEAHVLPLLAEALRNLDYPAIR